MASSLIHIAIAKKVQEKVDVDNEKDYYLGSIAPDIAKQIGLPRSESHFIINSRNGIPNIKLFTKRYPTFKYNSFNLGYFTHLYADKLWEEKVMSKIISNNSIKLLDGTIMNTTEKEMMEMVYSDYTNLNRSIIDKYNLDLSLFYEEFQKPDTYLKEIPVEKLDILLNKMSIIIENSNEEKAYTFDLYEVENFIEETTKIILKELEKY